MDSPCIKQTVCKVLKIFQHGKYLVAYVLKLLTEHHLEFLSLTGGRIGSSESTHVKMPHCWKSHALAHTLVVPCECIYSSSFIQFFMKYFACVFVMS